MRNHLDTALTDAELAFWCSWWKLLHFLFVFLACRWNDLLVGAPFYFNRQQEVGGAVYVYMNAGGRFHSEPTVVLMGSGGSAFGMAIAAAGDLNQDGYQGEAAAQCWRLIISNQLGWCDVVMWCCVSDFAVGAPFHDTGCVMIWTGGKEGISAEPSQVSNKTWCCPGSGTCGIWYRNCQIFAEVFPQASRSIHQSVCPSTPPVFYLGSRINRTQSLPSLQPFGPALPGEFKGIPLLTEKHHSSNMIFLWVHPLIHRSKRVPQT